MPKTGMYTCSPWRFFNEFCSKHGLRVVSLRSLRHLNASMLINAGLDVKTVQARACEAVSNALKLNFGA